MTKAVRHDAKKGLMRVQKNGRAEARGAQQFDQAERDRLLVDFRVDRAMIQRALAAIVVCDSLGYARETARSELQRSLGRLVSFEEVTRWATAHVQEQNDQGAFAEAQAFTNADTSEDEEYDEEWALEEENAEQERVLMQSFGNWDS